MTEYKQHQARLKPAGAALLALSLGLAMVCQFAHGFIFSVDYTGLPGIGLMISLYLILGAALLAAKKEGRLRMRKNPGGLFLLGCALALGACYGIYANQGMRFMNGIALAMVSVQAIYALCGYHGAAPLSALSWLQGLRGLFRPFFRHIPLPFWALCAKYREARGKKWRGLGTGLLIALPVLGIAAALLSSADQIFEDTLGGGLQALSGLDGGMLIRILLAVLLGLMLFSFLHEAITQEAGERMHAVRHAPPLTFAIVLWGLVVLYGLFAFIQFRYLFAGAEAARMQGGYAQYARSGFFQLVLLSCITLALLFPALLLCRESKPIRIAGGAVAVLTVIIDISAFFRMGLYIEAYGLTVLRVVTLWGMGAILIALLLAVVKCISPSFRAFPWLWAAVLITWIGLNYLNVDAQIAKYNVSSWERGQLAGLDAEYLGSLSPDVLPALEGISDQEAREEAMEQALQHLYYRRPAAYDWSLSWRHMPESGPDGGAGAYRIPR